MKWAIIVLSILSLRCAGGILYIYDFCSGHGETFFSGERICRTCETMQCPYECDDSTGEPTCLEYEKSYIATSVSDDLNDIDMYVMSNGFDELGYDYSIINNNVTYSELIEYLSSKADTLYHTGHGFYGGVNTSTNPVYLDVLIGEINVETIIFASCYTLLIDWKNEFGESKNIFGYSDKSWDKIDTIQAKSYIKFLNLGYTRLVSWILSNVSISHLSGVWVAYTNVDGNITKYEAESKSVPKYHVDNPYIVALNMIQKPISLKTMSGKTDSGTEPGLVLDEILTLNKNGIEVGVIQRYVKTFNSTKVRGTYEIHAYHISSDSTTIVSYLPDLIATKRMMKQSYYLRPSFMDNDTDILDESPVYVINNNSVVLGYDLLTNLGTVTVISDEYLVSK